MTRGVMFNVNSEESNVSVLVSGRQASKIAVLLQEHLEKLLERLRVADDSDLAATAAAMVAEDCI